MGAGHLVYSESHERTVALLTTDICDFTALTGAIGAEEVVRMLDTLYYTFDYAVTVTECYKVETIGDGAGGGTHAGAALALTPPALQRLLCARVPPTRGRCPTACAP